MKYWGIDIEEDKLIKLLKTSPNHGTNERDIVSVVKKIGLKVDLRDNITLEDLEKSVHGGIPVIVVVIGIDENNVYLEDLYILGSRGFIPRQEFVERWHNPGGSAPLYNEKQYPLGIFIQGGKPIPSRQFIRTQ